jgi:hypothetical protein
MTIRTPFPYLLFTYKIIAIVGIVRPLVELKNWMQGFRKMMHVRAACQRIYSFFSLACSFGRDVSLDWLLLASWSSLDLYSNLSCVLVLSPS